MWIKSQKGVLLNAAFLSSIEIKEKPDVKVTTSPTGGAITTPTGLPSKWRIVAKDVELAIFNTREEAESAMTLLSAEFKAVDLAQFDPGSKGIGDYLPGLVDGGNEDEF